MMRNATVEDVSRLTAMIHGAALDARLWADFVKETNRISGGVSCHILAYDDCGLETGFIAEGYDPASLDAYEEHYHRLNVWAPGFLKYGVGEVVDSRDMASDEILFASEFYHDWVKPHEDIRLGGGAVISQSQAGTFLLGGNIPSRYGDEAAANWLRLVGLLVPHLRIAWDTARALTSARIGGAGATILIVDAAGRVVFLDDPAGYLSQEVADISISVRGTLQFRQQHLSNYFQQLSKTVSQKDPPNVSRTFRTGMHRVAITALNAELIETTWPAVLSGAAGPCISVVVTKIQDASDRMDGTAVALGLTRAEAEVTLALARGQSPSEIADERAVSIHTIRNQIKSAMSKCGVSRQSQLVAMALGHE